MVRGRSGFTTSETSPRSHVTLVWFEVERGWLLVIAGTIGCMISTQTCCVAGRPHADGGPQADVCGSEGARKDRRVAAVRWTVGGFVGGMIPIRAARGGRRPTSCEWRARSMLHERVSDLEMTRSQ